MITEMLKLKRNHRLSKLLNQLPQRKNHLKVLSKQRKLLQLRLVIILNQRRLSQLKRVLLQLKKKTLLLKRRLLQLFLSLLSRRNSKPKEISHSRLYSSSLPSLCSVSACFMFTTECNKLLFLNQKRRLALLTSSLESMRITRPHQATQRLEISLKSDTTD